MKLVLALVAVALAVGCGDGFRAPVTGYGSRALALAVEKTVSVRAGDSTPFEVRASRINFDDPIALEFTGLPDGVTVQEPRREVPPGATRAVFTLTATDTVRLGKGMSFQVSARGGGLTAGPYDVRLDVLEPKADAASPAAQEAVRK